MLGIDRRVLGLVVSAGWLAACGADGPPDRLDAGDDPGLADGGEFFPDGGRPDPDGGSVDAGVDAGPVDGGIDAGPPPVCDRGDACCPDATCTDGSSCAGEVCSCIRAMHGDHIVRSDGTVAHRTAGWALIEIGDTGTVLDGMVDVYQGHFNACGLRDDGTVWCWPLSTSFPGAGQNGDGTLGTTGTRRQANQVLSAADTPLTDVAKLNGGDSRCYLASTYCAIKNDETVWCWGEGGNGGGGSVHTDGELRKPYATQLMADEKTPLTGVEQISLGRRHACAVIDGSVYCWGANIGGPLGQGNQTGYQYPTEVTLPGDPPPAVTKVGASSDFSCAITADGDVYCWGATGSGAVGIGTPSETTDGCINFCRLTPAAVIDTDDEPLTGAIDLHLAYLASCVVLDDHSLWCWGAGVGNRAVPLTYADMPVENVGLLSTCGSGELPGSLRYLTRDDGLQTPASTPQMCP